MGILEIVIASLLGLLLLSTGWLYKMSQMLISSLMAFGRSVLENLFKDTPKQPETRKKSKKT